MLYCIVLYHIVSYIEHALHCRNKRMCGGDIRVRTAMPECSRLLCVFVYRRIHNERGQQDVHNQYVLITCFIEIVWA